MLRRLIIAVPLFAFGAPACDSVTGVCTLMGCDSGLFVRLNAVPTEAFSVEVFARAPDESPGYRYECTPGPLGCQHPIFFSGFIADRAYIRVTTTDGSILHDVRPLRYESFRPNGPRCEPLCQTAEASVSIPVP